MCEKNISGILADLFRILGEIHPTELPKLLEASAETGIPLGRLLVMCRRLTEEELESAVRAAQLILKGETSTNRAAIVLAYSYFWHQPFDVVWQRTDFKKSNSVCMLLIAAGLLHTTRVIDLAKKLADGNSVGGLELYKAGLITLEQWRATLGQALLVKQQETNLRRLLYEPEDVNSTARQPVIDSNDEAERQRLGHMLMEAGLIAEEDLLCALERGLESGEPLGEILLFKHIITSFELTAALKLQSLVHEKSLTPPQAITWLRQVPESPGLQIVLGIAA